MSTKRPDNEGRSGKLDLGLGALLESTPPPTTPSAPAAAEPKPLAAGGAETEFHKLFREGKLRELVQRCESELTTSGQVDPEPRLWWVKAQLKLGEMPASIVAAPLESVSRRLVESGAPLTDQIRTLGGEILTDTARRLTDTGEFALAGTFLDRAESLGRRCGGDRRRLAEAAVRALEALPRIPRDRQVEYEQFKRILQAEPNDSPADPKALPGSGTSLVRDAAQYPTPFDGRPQVEEGGGLGQLARIAGIVILLGGIAIAALYGVGNIPWLSARVAPEGSPAKFEAPPPELVQAKPERVPGLEHLDAIYYELNQKKKGAESGKKAESPPEQGRTTTTDRAVVPGRTVRTDGPLEPDSVREARLRPEGPADVAARDPNRTDPRQIMNSTTTKTSNSNPPILLYQAVVKTRVLRAPSLRSSVVAELKQGDRILVEGRDGDFYRIRSRRGNTAYVLVQDLEEVPN